MNNLFFITYNLHNIMKYLIITSIISFFIITTAHSQSKDILAKSYFLKSQEYYGNNDNSNALIYLEKCIENLGTSNPKIEAMYVRILTEPDKAIERRKHLDKYFAQAKDNHSDYIEMVEIAIEVNENAKAYSRKQKQAKIEEIAANKLKPLWDKAQNKNSITAYEEYIEKTKNEEVNPYLEKAKAEIKYQKNELQKLTGNSTPFNLSTLYLSSRNLTSLPESIDNLTELFLLNLSDNRLSSLPENFGNLSKLSQLNLEGNNLTSLPENFGKLTKLFALEINNNNLTSLPESFGKLTNLAVLILSDNRLSSLPDNFDNLSGLGQLRLEENNLTSLPESFGNLSKLIQLNLRGNNLTSLPKSFGNLSNLKGLNLKGNNLTSLPESFGNLTNLKTLVLSEFQKKTLKPYLKKIKKKLPNLEIIYQ